MEINYIKNIKDSFKKIYKYEDLELMYKNIVSQPNLYSIPRISDGKIFAMKEFQL